MTKELEVIRNIKNRIVRNDTIHILNCDFWNKKAFENKMIYLTGHNTALSDLILKTIARANEEYALNIKTNRLFSKNKTIDFALHIADEEKFSSKTFKKTEKLFNFLKKNNTKAFVYAIPGKDPENQKFEAQKCLEYSKKYNIQTKILKLPSVICSNIDYFNPDIFSYIARCIVEKETIELNSFNVSLNAVYITDVINAIFLLLEKGEVAIYEIKNSSFSKTTGELLEFLSKKYYFLKFRENQNSNPPEIPVQFDTSKLEKTGWIPQVGQEEAISRLVSSFIYQKNKLKKGILQLLAIGLRRIFKRYINPEYIFSIKNKAENKIVNILGWQYKINRKVFYKDKLGKIQKNKIIFNSFNGGYLFACNPKYIALEILKRKLPYEIIWFYKGVKKLTKEDRCELPSNIKLVEYKTKKAIKELYSAKVIVSNSHNNPLITRGWVKSPKQKLIQTWHGSLGIKKFDKDVKNEKSTFFNPHFYDVAAMDVEYTDYFLSNSKFEDEIVAPAFGFEKSTTKIGHPRNDVFFYSENEKQAIKEKVYNKLNIPLDKKILLYAPSFRDDFYLDCFYIDTKRLLKTLGKDWVIILKLHPRMKDLAGTIFQLSKNIIDASLYLDIQELLVAASIGITDYSSWIFDYMLSYKPAFIYAVDIEKYNSERGLYFPLESTPFPVAKNNNELIKNIKDFDFEKYKTKVKEFLDEKDCMEDGLASKRAVDIIEEIMKNA